MAPEAPRRPLPAPQLGGDIRPDPRSRQVAGMALSQVFRVDIRRLKIAGPPVPRGPLLPRGAMGSSIVRCLLGTEHGRTASLLVSELN